MKIYLRAFLTVIAVMVLFFVMRYPFYFQPFDGQDGNGQNSQLFLKGGHEPGYLINAKMGDSYEHEGPRHPGFLFEVPNLYGKWVRSFDTFEGKSSARIVAELKFWFGLSHLLFWLFALCFFWAWRRDPVIVFVFIALMWSRIAVLTSTEVQTDSFIGFPICGLFALFVGYPVWQTSQSAKNLKKWDGLQAGIFFIGSAFVSLGKSEWTVCFGVTWLVMLVFTLIRKRLRPSRESVILPYLVFALFGMIVGNIVSYFISPYNYRESWNLVLMMTSKHTAPSVGMDEFLYLTRGRFTWARQIVVTLLFCIIHFRKLFHPKNENLLFLFLLTGCFFSAFSLATWGFDARYFAPAFGFSVPLLIYAIVEFKPKPWVKYSLLAYLVWWGILKNATWCYRAYRDNNWNWSEAPPRTDCVPILRTEHVLAFPNADYIHFFVSEGAAAQYSQRYNKVVCTTDEEAAAQKATQIRRE